MKYIFCSLGMIGLFFSLSCGQLKTRTEISKSKHTKTEHSGSQVNLKNQESMSYKKSDFNKDYLGDFCYQQMSFFPGPYDKSWLKQACKKVEVLDGCQSHNGDPIIHYDKKGETSNAKRVLAISMIHGDEIPAGSVSRNWMARLENIDPRNYWRIIPLANPDGVKSRTRTNANKVDINRNFPSSDWDQLALKYWREKKKSDPRRYPGPTAVSEIETRCLVKHINDFQPDFIISVHTPLGVLDFDGPRVSSPNFKPLPWISLGNFPGSLGRYMWVDNKVPVLTIELKGSEGLRRLEEFDQLQDVTGTIAIQADKMLKKNKKENHEH